MFKTYALVLSAIIGLWLPPCFGNPVPDETVRSFNNLIEHTARTGDCKNPEKLISYFREYGLGLLDEESLQSIPDNFDHFAALLLDSQRAPYPPNVGIQTLFRIHADRTQEREMILVLRHWLAADIKETRSGLNRIFSGEHEDYTRDEVDRDRLRAALLLADWQDSHALSLIAPILKREDLKAETRHGFEQARARLMNPHATGLYQWDLEGDVMRCGQLSRIASIGIAETNSYYPRESSRWEYSLTREEIRQFWTFAKQSELQDWPYRSWSTQHTLQIVFEDETGASISLLKDGSLIYSDFSITALPGRRMSLDNPALYYWIEQLWQRETVIVPSRR